MEAAWKYAHAMQNEAKILSEMQSVIFEGGGDYPANEFIIGSGKLYSVTLNGYLIISSATTGKVETFKKIGSPVTSSPIIADGKMYILSEDSKLFGFN